MSINDVNQRRAAKGTAAEDERKIDRDGVEARGERSRGKMAPGGSRAEQREGGGETDEEREERERCADRANTEQSPPAKTGQAVTRGVR